MDAKAASPFFTLLLLAAPGSAISAQISWSEPLEIAAGGGERGPWRQNDSRYDYVDDPTVAMAPGGEVLIAWVDQARKDVYFAKLERSGERTNASNVSRTPATFSWLPRIAIDPRDAQHIVLLWQEIIFSGGSHGGDILFARSTDGGAAFDEPLNLSRSIAGDGKGRITRDIWDNGSLDVHVGTAGVFAAWTEYEGALWFARSDDGARFTEPLRISGARGAKPARAPSIAADGRTVYLAYTVGETSAADIQLAISNDGGATFDSPRTIEATPAYSDAPALAIDARGVLHAVFAESAGGPFERYEVHYTQSRDRGRTFDPSRAISTPSSAGRTGGAAHPTIALDAQGGVYLVWEAFRDARGRPHGLGFSFSQDRGRDFSPPALIPNTTDERGANGSQQGLLMRKLAVRGRDIAVVNSTLEPDVRSRVVLVRGVRK